MAVLELESAQRSALERASPMRIVVERGCGLDIGQAVVVACVLTGRPGDVPRKTIRTFSTMTQDLLALRAWLESEGVTHVAMEATGIYWRPIHAILEEAFVVLVANAHHIKAVPGRKTDVKDSEWIADLLRHGLLTSSFIPPPPLRDIRDLLRYRRSLVEARAAERNRVLKFLETANIKLSSVISDVFGVSGMAILRALATGSESPSTMAEMAKGRLRRRVPELVRALEGNLREHHRFLLCLQIHRLQEFDRDLATIEQRIEEKIQPFLPQRELLTEVPGVDRLTSASFIAEVGVDMGAFHGASHLASWTGVAPGNNESAGKRRRARVRRGNPHLKPVLIQAALAASRKRDSYFHQKFLRLRARSGHQRAVMAIAHKLVITMYYILARGAPYRDLGADYLDKLRAKSTARSLVRRLQGLGYNVILEPTAA
jgi:transposase